MRRPRRSATATVCALAVAVAAAGCGAGSTTVVAFVPSSFTDVAPVVTDGIDGTEGDVDIDWVIAGSSRLVAQLDDGARADLLVTADEATMARAVEHGVVDAPDGVLARNRLVLAATPAGRGPEISALEDLTRPDLLVGVCAPDVPCGRLAARVLTAAGLDVAADTEEPNVRSLAVKIASGELDTGLVYATDARALGLTVIDDPRLADARTDYPYALLDPRAEPIVAFLTSPTGRAALVGRGFEVP